MSISYLGLGSNLGTLEQNLQDAITYLHSSQNIEVLQVSSFYKTKALVPPERANEIQPDYLNAVCKIRTSLEPQKLLALTQKIEFKLGRQRSQQRWEPRTIDIDILLYDQLILQEDNLVIPHPEMLNRDFVKLPLREIASELVLPNGQSLIRNPAEGI